MRVIGGKNQLAPYLVSLLPPHHTLVEVFGATGPITRLTETSPVRVYNDKDYAWANFWRIAQQPENIRPMLARLKRILGGMPPPVLRAQVRRGDLDRFRATIRRASETGLPSLGAAVATWALMFQTHTGDIWRGSKWNSTDKGEPDVRRRFGRSLPHLVEVGLRFAGVTVLQQDFRDVLVEYDSPGTGFYNDPPYAPGTRMANLYGCEMGEDDHRDFIDLLLGLRGKAMVSGMPMPDGSEHPLYLRLGEHGWRLIHFGRSKNSEIKKNGDRRARQVESVWLNY